MKNPKLEDILAGIRGAHYMSKWSKEKGATYPEDEAQQAIFQAGLEIIGYRDERGTGRATYETGWKDNTPAYLIGREKLRAELRSKWAEFCGVREAIQAVRGKK